jgi:HEAT repeat protein
MYCLRPFIPTLCSFLENLRSAPLLYALCLSLSFAANADQPKPMPLESVFQTVASHPFHPLNEEGTFTIDSTLGEHGIADMDDQDWRVRLLALRDLVRAGLNDRAAIEAGLRHKDRQVRYLAAAALGILGDVNAAPALEEIAVSDPSPLVRSQAVVALGQIQAKQSIDTLEALQTEDPVKDVRHQAELSLDQIRKGMGVTADYRNTWLELDPSTFESVEAGRPAPDFTLKDTEDKTWNWGTIPAPVGSR